MLDLQLLVLLKTEFRGAGVVSLFPLCHNTTTKLIVKDISE